VDAPAFDRHASPAAVDRPSLTEAGILSRGHVAEALAWTRTVMTRLGLTLNEAKNGFRRHSGRESVESGHRTAVPVNFA
jgi:hypothetical protein